MNATSEGIYSVFPQPVKISFLPRVFTTDELDLIRSLPQGPNTGNYRSLDTRVLHREGMQDLLGWCTDEINSFLQQIYRPSTSLSSYITQSWVNYTPQGASHHEHWHANSFISGVLYIDTDPLTDSITFVDSNKSWFQIIAGEYNTFNSNSCSFTVGSGSLFLFPSGLSHRVGITENPGTRVSLSFNTFLEGDLGSDWGLTHLPLVKPAGKIF
jgi:uncharacterized protein (TIGR02466 family)